MGPVAVGEPPGGEPLLTRMCSPPSCAAAWATMASTCALLVTSAASGRMRRPVSAESSRAVASSWSFVRATMATSTPRGQLEHDGFSDAEASHRDDRVLAAQPKVHRRDLRPAASRLRVRARFYRR
jgi:hypothetical protein